jgi:hypothetical protein
MHTLGMIVYSDRQTTTRAAAATARGATKFMQPSEIESMIVSTSAGSSRFEQNGCGKPSY